MAISIRLPDDIEARLNKLAAKTGRTKSFYIREAIAEHVVDLDCVKALCQSMIRASSVRH